MKKGSKKPRIHAKVCKFCQKEYLAADTKGCMCYDCKRPKPCSCGCGKIVKTPGRYFYPNHMKTGKTYLQIYGTESPACGAKRGELNISKRLDVKAKISVAVSNSYVNDKRLLDLRRIQRTKLNLEGSFKGKVYKNKIGERFRSRLEVFLSEIFLRHGIRYTYELPVRLINDKHKLVDFVVKDVYIEVSGYAYDGWRKGFSEKIKLLRKTIDNPIILLTYPENLDSDTDLSIKKLADSNLTYASVFDEERILSLIEFYQNVYSVNKEIDNDHRIHDT